MGLKEIKQKLIPIFEKEKGVLFAYIFGSQALGKTNFESDIDIAVYLDEKRVKDLFEKRLSLIGKLEGILKKQTEVVVLNEIKSIFFKFVIIKEGKIIFERDQKKRVEFELSTIQEYFDFKPFIEKYDQAFIEKYS